mgnify:CR=1 FL=1|jgi:hypothetical protein
MRVSMMIVATLHGVNMTILASNLIPRLRDARCARELCRR